ncbi:MAG: type II toxin-antitoxin system HicB family antitoxin [Desulfococcaceae bacterium]|jgi:predicted RNase H-like HicB family nuclease|nr:type II toxin-antitoxin system HicB family antitoxin [Desulfococcaceae bacterium]
MKLKIVLEKGLDGYIIAYCPSLKGCVTQGKNEEEAIANLKEAVELWLEPDPCELESKGNLYKVCEVAV